MPNFQRITPVLVYEDIESGRDFLVSAWPTVIGPLDSGANRCM
jgi:hypothetical protein